MSDRTTPYVSPMEGKGFYNKHATVQAGGGALALSLLERAAHLVDVGPGDRPLCTASGIVRQTGWVEEGRISGSS
jgi:hypothetical protein